MVGDNIRRCRKRVGLKQRELGAMVGVDNTQISCWERGVNVPRVGAIEKLCAALGVGIEDLAVGALPSSWQPKE